MEVETSGSEPQWQFSLRDAEATIESALAQRDADRRNPNFEPNTWALVSEEVYAWAKAKTYLAAVLCGLVARATDELANPLSLHVGELAGGYAATSLWQVIQTHAQGRMDLKHLKSQPFNNSPFYGKRVLSSDWENVSSANRPRLERTVQLMQQLAQMSRSDARFALRSFLYGVPDDEARGVLVATVVEGALDLNRFFTALDDFLLDDGESGRRAQAMVAAALALVHGDNVATAESIHDPSRSLPGDVRVVSLAEDGNPHALFAEAKQKVTEPEWIDQFATEIHAYAPGGTAAYGALVNDRAAARAKRIGALPDWRDVLHERGVISVIWTNPADMVRDAVVWSALDAHQAVVRFVEFYAKYLVHVETQPDTIDAWRRAAREFGVESVRL